METISFICTHKKDTNHICNTVLQFINIILSYDSIINSKQNLKIYSNYTILIDDIIKSNSSRVRIKNKKTNETTKHFYFLLGNYHIETETWRWHNNYHNHIKSIIDDMYNKYVIYSSNIKKIVDKMLQHTVSIRYEHHFIIPYFIQIILPITTLQRFDISDNSGHIYMLFSDFGKKFGYELNIDYDDFVFKMDTLNMMYLKNLQKNNNMISSSLSRPNIRKNHVVKKIYTHEIQNGLENDYNHSYTTDLSKFKISSHFGLSRSNKLNTLNSKIIKWFELLIKQLVFYVNVKTGKDKLIYSYKIKAIKKALNIIKNVDFKITDGKQLQKYKGIGTGTIDRINEILTTGGLIEINKADISGKHLEYVDNLMKIFGVGHVKAYELYTVYGIKSISDLKKAIKNKTIELPENIIKGIKYVDKIKIDIPRSEVEDIAIYLINTGIKYDPNIDIRVCGSYRRENKTSNDIDIIISHPDIITKQQAENSDIMNKFIKYLIKSNFIVDSLTSLNVPTKYMGICRLTRKHKMRRIDIRFIPQESYYTAILYFTGSRSFNKKMRGVALSMGYTLNEYRLLDEKGKPFKVSSEKDIFDILNMEYLQPVYRK